MQKLLELEDAAEDERKELISKIDSLESIVRMLELKTKNSHDHGTNVTDTSSHRKTPYSRVDYFEFILCSVFIFDFVLFSIKYKGNRTICANTLCFCCLFVKLFLIFFFYFNDLFIYIFFYFFNHLLAHSFIFFTNNLGPLQII